LEIVSLFGILRCGWRLILWKASPGISGSCGLGFLLFPIAIEISPGHNC
jgi:hypothetical protein